MATRRTRAKPKSQAHDEHIEDLYEKINHTQKEQAVFGQRQETLFKNVELLTQNMSTLTTDVRSISDALSADIRMVSDNVNALANRETLNIDKLILKITAILTLFGLIGGGIIYLSIGAMSPTVYKLQSYSQIDDLRISRIEEKLGFAAQAKRTF